MSAPRRSAIFAMRLSPFWHATEKIVFPCLDNTRTHFHDSEERNWGTNTTTTTTTAAAAAAGWGGAFSLVIQDRGYHIISTCLGHQLVRHYPDRIPLDLL